MTISIDKKITGWNIKKEESEVTVIKMHEEIKRPEFLAGCTYKIKTPLSDHALYVTINDIILNEGTDQECYRPFEVFINSKNMEDFQWIVALTRVMSAVFRKGGNIHFLVDELRSVFNPSGGYFKKGGKYMPSLIAEIGEIIEQHMISTGVIKKPELDENQKEFIEKKKAEIEQSSYPAGATLCSKCNTVAVVIMDGCATCLSCGDSKCS